MKSNKKVIETLTVKYGLNEWEAEIVSQLRRERPVLTTILRHVSQSGMMRHIDVYWLCGQDKPAKWDQRRYPRNRIYLSGLIAKICDRRRAKDGYALKVGGCGMDMGFHVVYNFSSVIFPDGFRYRKNEGHRNGDPSKRDKDGGYALTHEWL